MAFNTFFPTFLFQFQLCDQSLTRQEGSVERSLQGAEGNITPSFVHFLFLIAPLPLHFPVALSLLTVFYPNCRSEGKCISVISTATERSLNYSSRIGSFGVRCYWVLEWVADCCMPLTAPSHNEIIKAGLLQYAPGEVVTRNV